MELFLRTFLPIGSQFDSFTWVSLDTALLLVFSCHFRDTALGAVLQKRQKEAPDSERRLKKDRLWSLS